MTNLSVRPWMTHPPPIIGPKENLRRARTLLRADNVQELLVVEDGKLVGMLNDHDIWAHCPTGVLLLEEDQANDLLEHMRVGGVMTLHPPVVTPETSLREALELFAHSGRQGLPVLDNGRVVGILTEARALHATAAALGEVEHYTALKQN